MDRTCNIWKKCDIHLKVWSKNMKGKGKCNTLCSCAQHMIKTNDAAEKSLCIQGCPFHESLKSHSSNVGGSFSVLQGLLESWLICECNERK